METSLLTTCANSYCKKKFSVPTDRGTLTVACPFCGSHFKFMPPQSAVQSRDDSPPRYAPTGNTRSAHPSQFSTGRLDCRICQRPVQRDVVTLTNGDVIHQACEADLLEKLQSLTQKLQEHVARKESLVATVDLQRREVALYSNSSFVSTLRDVFFAGPSGTREFKLSAARTKLNEAQRALETYEKDADSIARSMQGDIRRFKLLLTSIYDYWPDYPPDWDERRDSLENEADGQCQRCRFLKYRPNRNDTRRHFHAHHVIPLSKRGSHKLDNLKFLCSKCHQKEHAHGLREDFSATGRSSLQTGFTEKVTLINQAIANKAPLKFKYKKHDGEIMIRTVDPASIGLDNIVHKTQVMAGFCHLRKDTRHFRISRMSQIQVMK